jgi:HSP20 family protein
MFKKLINTALLATLPMVALHADNHLRSDPFANDPMFKHFQKIQEEMNKIFEKQTKDMFKGLKFDTQFSNNLDFSSKEEMKEKEDSYTLKVDLPNIDQKSINVKIKDNMLTIDAKNEEKKEEKKDGKVVISQAFTSVFHRSMSIPSDVDADKMKTDFKEGILTITLPKKK